MGVVWQKDTRSSWRSSGGRDSIHSKREAVFILDDDSLHGETKEARDDIDEP
jgi:hypothetical protein